MDDLAPLFALTLRTPTLELRLGDEDEVVALGRLAGEGIHDPEEMPFGVAWSDAIGTPSFLDEFVAYHRDMLRSWRPHDWHLNLLVWRDGELVATQSVAAELFAEQREVTTGSWVGRRFQGEGIGTEMRAAVLGLAFDHLGADAALSGWLEGNPASARVSEKLGYEETGISTVRPRGTPVPHHDVRLERERWTAPWHVSVEGIAPCLPYFGV